MDDLGAVVRAATTEAKQRGHAELREEHVLLAALDLPDVEVALSVYWSRFA